MELIYKKEAYEIIGAAMEVHRELGPGFLEAVCQEALAIEFGTKGIPFEREPGYKVTYKDIVLKKHYVPDFVCYNKIIVELKSLPEVKQSWELQILNYLKITGFRLGLLLNFGEKSLVHKRLVF